MQLGEFEIKDFSKYIPYKVGRFIGAGSYGYIFDLKDFPNRIIKISDELDPYRARNLKYIFKQLLGKKFEKISYMYDYKFFTHKKKKFFYYVAEKLQKIRNDKFQAFRKQHICHDDKWVKPLSKKYKLYYFDWHNGNVLKCKKGKLKICDLDGFIDQDITYRKC